MWASLLALRRIAAMGNKKPAFYAVAVGRKVGIYKTWAECQAEVIGWSGAKFKSFNQQQDAVNFIETFNKNYGAATEKAQQRPPTVGIAKIKASESNGEKEVPRRENSSLEEEEEQKTEKMPASQAKRGSSSTSQIASSSSKKRKIKDIPEEKGNCTDVTISNSNGARVIEVYTDGASSSNGKVTAAAGWGVYWPESEDRDSDLYQLNESRRLPGSLQTNNRAELMGIIRAIQICPDPKAQLVIYTDSQYCIKAINQWQQNWRKQKWLTSSKDPVLNKDLIRLLERELRSRTLRPRLVYVKGHSSSRGNQEADRLAVKGASKPAIARSQWVNLEPSDSEEESPQEVYQKAVAAWQRYGFTLEDAKTKAGAEP